MANTIKTFVSDGTTTIYTFDFDYINTTFVKTLVNGVEVGRTLSGTYQVTLDAAPASNDVIVIKRETSTDRLVDFVDGSILVAQDLNLAALQAIHIAEEALDAAAGSFLIDNTGAFSAGGRRVSGLGTPTEANDAVTVEWAETYHTSLLAQAIVARDAAEAAAVATQDFVSQVSEDIDLASFDPLTTYTNNRDT